MKELTGTGLIPQPIKGYELRVYFTKIDIENDLIRCYTVDDKCLRWQDSVFGDFALDKDEPVASWILIPILNSGIWISGEMPLPEAKENTLLIVSILRNNRNEFMIFTHSNGNWIWSGIPVEQINSYYYINQWQWISKP